MNNLKKKQKVFVTSILFSCVAVLCPVANAYAATCKIYVCTSADPMQVGAREDVYTISDSNHEKCRERALEFKSQYPNWHISYQLFL